MASTTSELRERNVSGASKRDDDAFSLADAENGVATMTRAKIIASYERDGIINFLRLLWYFYMAVMVIGGVVMVSMAFLSDIGAASRVENAYMTRIVFPVYAVVFVLLAIFRKDYKVTTFCIIIATAVFSYTLGAMSIIMFNDVAAATTAAQSVVGAATGNGSPWLNPSPLFAETV